MAVDVKAGGSSFEPGVPKLLFEKSGRGYLRREWGRAAISHSRSSRRKLARADHSGVELDCGPEAVRLHCNRSYVRTRK